mmetsp:Transcript_38292/g.62084  ORF Transcript_38292/g.62084 Transcript_38292/m.62084 type:complete len:103 (-) Transcript_38292:1866-2174(-)
MVVRTCALSRYRSEIVFVLCTAVSLTHWHHTPSDEKPSPKVPVAPTTSEHALCESDMISYHDMPPHKQQCDIVTATVCSITSFSCFVAPWSKNLTSENIELL